MQPYVVSDILGPEGEVIDHLSPVCKRQVLKEETSRTMREMMEAVVLYGGGRNARITGCLLYTSVHCDKFNALQAIADHAVDRVAAAAANTDHLDRRNVFVHFFIEHECHIFFLHRILS